MAQTILSVRGEARRTVSPDYAVCHFGLQAVDGSTAAALERVAGLQATAACRELDSLAAVVEALAVIDGVSFGGVTWLVDHDNAGWRLVRADAIAAALAKGSDYATALGGTVRSVEHVADQGLLSDGDHAGPHDVVSLAARASAGGGDRPVPRLDPEPQELRAVIEARLVAEVPALGAGD